jgi:hypothetical protein
MRALRALLALCFLLAVPALPGLSHGDRWGSEGGSPAGYGAAATVFELNFSGDGGITTAQCFNVNTAALSNEATCTSYASVGHIFVPAGVPRIKRLSCTLWASNVAGHAAGETVTVTPVWFQGDGAATITPVDSNVSIVFNDGDDQLGDTLTNTTTSANSPYTGAQGLELRANIAGGDGVVTTALGCQVVVESL